MLLLARSLGFRREGRAVTKINPHFLRLLCISQLSECNSKTQPWFFRSREGTPDGAKCTEEENEECACCVWLEHPGALLTSFIILDTFIYILSLFPRFNVYLFHL